PLRGATPRVPSAPGGSLVGIVLFVNTFRELFLCLFGCLARVHFPMPSPLPDGADRLRLGGTRHEHPHTTQRHALRAIQSVTAGRSRTSTSTQLLDVLYEHRESNRNAA